MPNSATSICYLVLITDDEFYQEDYTYGNESGLLDLTWMSIKIDKILDNAFLWMFLLPEDSESSLQTPNIW